MPVGKGRQTEIPADDYDVVVFENRFPSFARLQTPASRRTTSRRAGAAAARSCASPATTTRRSATLPPERVRLVVDAWADRTAALAELPAGRAGLLLREPRRGDRRHARPPARPDLRLPVRDAPDPPMLDAARRHRERTWRTCSPTCSPPSSPTGPGWWRRSEHWVAFVPSRRPLAGRGAPLPAPQVPDLPALSDARARRLRPALPRRPRRHGPPVRRPAPVHLGLAPGARPGRPRPALPAPAGVLDQAGGEQAEVPRRVRVGHGRVHQRRHAGAGRGQLRAACRSTTSPTRSAARGTPPGAGRRPAGST